MNYSISRMYRMQHQNISPTPVGSGHLSAEPAFPRPQSRAAHFASMQLRFFFGGGDLRCRHVIETHTDEGAGRTIDVPVAQR